MNKDSYKSVLALPRSHSKPLFYLSFLSLFSGLFALKRGYWDLALVPLGVGINSLNYWRHPDYSWRRYVDMVWVAVSCSYQCIRAIEAENRVFFFAILGVSISAFYPSLIYHREKRLTISTILHSIVHIGGNISNLVLYRGWLPPLSSAWFLLLINRCLVK